MTKSVSYRIPDMSRIGNFGRLAALVACLAVGLPLGATAQVQQTSLSSFGNRQAEWSDSFDATLPEVDAVNSLQPTLSRTS